MLAVVIASLLVVFAPAAPGAAEPTIIRTITEQATIEADFSTPGLKFNLNAGRERVIVNGALSGDNVKAVGSVFLLECQGTGCGTVWLALCRPLGTLPGLEFLPPGSLRFWPKFGKATLEAELECTRTDGGAPIRLAVDLKWHAKATHSEHSVTESPGPPLTITEQDVQGAFDVTPKGSVFDGTVEYVGEATRGALVTRETTTTEYG